MTMSSESVETRKIARLQTATDEAQKKMAECEAALKDSEIRLRAAKDLLKQLDPDEQQRIQVQDTPLPRLLESHLVAQNNYQQALTRYNTNQRYLHALKETKSTGQGVSTDIQLTNQTGT
mmetsp:Transcript_22669/g.32469  ORF Transcript_22669/g.32469 Transcript_22669/m.32469 type:complete len:120 (+) Transcript_22669:34-393(+)